VNLGKIGRQLRREMTANPKKAGILGLLGVVALYFWAPLMAGWFTKDEKHAASASPAKPPVAIGSSASPAPSEAVAPAATQVKAKDPQYTWRELVDWIEGDPRTRPAGPLPPECNPFQPPKPADVQVRKAEPRSIVHEVTPQGANLMLSSTIVGSGLRVARISGKSYRPGDTVTIKLKGGQELEFMIAEIEARSVVLERLGKRYKLKIQTPKPLGTIEIVER
jgi:hypothetical protein